MTDDIPQWALERAAELACEVATKPIYNADKVVNLHLGQAFARYIAQHEEDPLLIEAREIAAKYYDADASNAAHLIRGGRWDDVGAIKWVVDALRRGIELGKAGAA